MKKNTLADFFLPPYPKGVDDDKNKIKRLEQEISRLKLHNDELTIKNKELKSENFALNVGRNRNLH